MAEKTKVLVVDDDRAMVRTVCDLLRLKGYAVEAAYTGEEAVEKVRSEPPDCVLLDMKMPGISGVEALQRIREIVPAVPVLLISAYVTEEQAAEARRLGADGVLTKPVELQEVFSFLEVLGRVMGRS